VRWRRPGFSAELFPFEIKTLPVGLQQPCRPGLEGR
jgi:hypothetical protein